MKKYLFAGVALLALPLSSQAAGYSAAGCGFGSMLFEGQSGLGPHVMAATTNGFYGTQTFAMSSGTLGCDVNSPIVSQTALYIDSNIDQVAIDMSKGQGEALNALAAVLGVEKVDQPHFRQTMHDNFASIFSNTDVTSAQVTESVLSVMNDDAVLRKYIA